VTLPPSIACSQLDSCSRFVAGEPQRPAAVGAELTGNADVAKQKRFAENRTDSHKNARLTPKG